MGDMADELIAEIESSDEFMDWFDYWSRLGVPESALNVGTFGEHLDAAERQEERRRRRISKPAIKINRNGVKRTRR